MAIIEVNEHMKISMYVLLSIGAWPLELIGHPKLQRLYNIYSYSMFGFFIAFVVRQVIELIRLLFFTEINIVKIMQNASLTLVTIIATVRNITIKGKNFRKLIQQVEIFEKIIDECQDTELTTIYNDNVWFSQMTCKVIITAGLIGSVPFYFGPIVEYQVYPEWYPPDNITGKINYRLPLSEWLPYDYQNYYISTFILQIADGWITECHVVYTDTLILVLLIFPVGQMQMLQNIMKRFKIMARRAESGYAINYDEASLRTMKACIVYHQEILDYCSLLDETLKWLMLLDFASCSVQMGILLFQVIMAGLNAIMFFALLFLMGMVVQMFLFYWNANEITVEGLKMGPAIWEGHWYDETLEVQKCCQIMMLKCQRPITINIGKLEPMSNEVAIKIMKATYSYGTLLSQSLTRTNKD